MVVGLQKKERDELYSSHEVPSAITSIVQPTIYLTKQRGSTNKLKSNHEILSLSQVHHPTEEEEDQ